jgi:large subunit ribosomal protein L25
MASVTLTVELRAKGGNRALREIRRGERVPGVFYGPTTEPVLLAVEEKELALKLGGRGGSQLVQFACPEGGLEGKMALLKEVQSHPVTGDLLHIDFYAVDESRSVKVRAPLNFLGKAEGVTAGGILQPLRRDLRVECLPSNIPSSVDVDVSELNIHDTIHVEDLVLPEGVTVIADTNFAIVTVLPPTVEVVEAPAEAAAEGEAPPSEEAPEGAEQPAPTGGEG